MSVQTEQCPKLECPNAIPLHQSSPSAHGTINASAQVTHQFRFLFHFVLPLCCVMAERQEILMGDPARETAPKLGYPHIISAPAQGRHKSETTGHPG